MKSIFKSKVFWVNVLTIVSAFAAIYDVTPNPELMDKTAVILTLLTPYFNIILRFFTSKNVTLTGK